MQPFDNSGFYCLLAEELPRKFVFKSSSAQIHRRANVASAVSTRGRGSSKVIYRLVLTTAISFVPLWRLNTRSEKDWYTSVHVQYIFRRRLQISVYWWCTHILHILPPWENHVERNLTGHRYVHEILESLVSPIIQAMGSGELLGVSPSPASWLIFPITGSGTHRTPVQDMREFYQSPLSQLRL